MSIHPFTCQGEQRRTSRQKGGLNFFQRRPETLKMNERFPTNSRTLSDRRSVSDKGYRKEKKKPGRMRQDLFGGKSFVAVKLHPDLVIPDLPVIGWRKLTSKPAWMIWIIQDSSPTSTIRNS